MSVFFTKINFSLQLQLRRVRKRQRGRRSQPDHYSQQQRAEAAAAPAAKEERGDAASGVEQDIARLRDPASSVTQLSLHLLEQDTAGEM